MRYTHLHGPKGLSQLNFLDMDYLSKLENQSIYIMREAFNKF
ncbi:MAG: hypothetical protein JWM99_3325, partial [Verrucomicrobiales bacterium]|nr:hypothetical protein [Verrucomicrobiales bacterium]